MRVAILGDTRLPTAAHTPGHGMGKVNLTIANGLRDCGHDVTLFGGIGSAFDGKLTTAKDEREFAVMDFSGYDAILDGGHFHTLSKKRPELPVLNLSQDRESSPGKNAVFSSKAHRDWHGYNERTGRVVYNGVEIPTIGEIQKGDYYLYLSMMHSPKAPIMAAEAGRLAGVRVVFAGLTPPGPPPGSEYIGAVWGDDKYRLIARAKALLFCSAIEAGTVTPLEANACGTPVICLPWGAASENMADGVTGLVVRDTLEMAEAIGKIERGDVVFTSEACKRWVRENRSVERMIDEYEKLLAEVSAGITW